MTEAGRAVLSWLPCQGSLQGLRSTLSPPSPSAAMYEEDSSLDMDWVCLSYPPKKLEGMCYTFEIYSFISLQTLFFLPTNSLKLWACNILTCNRHWLMSNRSQNMFFVSMLLFWQHWPQVNIYIRICKHVYIHISTCINSAIRTAFYSNHCPMLSTILITSDAEKRKNGNSALQITYWWPLVNDRQAKLQGTCYLELEFQANIFLHF